MRARRPGRPDECRLEPAAARRDQRDLAPAEDRPGSPATRTNATARAGRPAPARPGEPGAEASARPSSPTGSPGGCSSARPGCAARSGAGPNRMNRAVVRAATAALAGLAARARPRHWRHGPEAWSSAATRGTARPSFADEAAAVLAGAGIAVHLLPPRQARRRCSRSRSGICPPRPGIMITASHNPRRRQRLQALPGRWRADRAAGRRRRSRRRSPAWGRCHRSRPASLDGPLVTRHGDEVAQAYLDAILRHPDRP